jgi:uncharacterized phage protein (TIGR02218 family)
MSKVLSVALAAHYASDATTLARLWKLTRTDGAVFGFTDHDEPISYAGTRYEPSSAFDASAIQTRSELNVDSASGIGLLDSAGITAADIEAGRWDGAALQIVEVNYADLSMGHNPLRAGDLGNIQRDGPWFHAEMRGLLYRLQNNIGRIVKPSCDATLGDARCGVDLDGSPGFSTGGVVLSAASARQFSTDSVAVLGFHEGWFDFGTVRWLDGLNAGLAMEIKQHIAVGSPAGEATLVLQLPMPYAIWDGDAFELQPGCDKRKATCIAKFNNVLNFRGFSFVPGQDKVLLIGGQ